MASTIFIKLSLRSFFSVLTVLRCSSFADVEPLVSGGTVFFFMLLKFSYIAVCPSLSPVGSSGVCASGGPSFFNWRSWVCNLCSFSSSRVTRSKFQWLQILWGCLGV